MTLVAAVHRHVLAASLGVVVLSLGAGFLYAVTSVLQHGAMRVIPTEKSMRPSLLLDQGTVRRVRIYALLRRAEAPNPPIGSRGAHATEACSVSKWRR